MYAANIDYNVQDTGAWVGEAISKGLKRQLEIKISSGEDVRAWQGEAPYRCQHRHQEARVYYYYEPEPRVGSRNLHVSTVVKWDILREIVDK